MEEGRVPEFDETGRHLEPGPRCNSSFRAQDSHPPSRWLPGRWRRRRGAAHAREKAVEIVKEPPPDATQVLLVDDEPQVIWMLQFSLQAEGYRTLSARNGLAALQVLREHRPELMLLDIMMPVMDGWSVLEALQELDDDERPRVIVVSARASSRDRQKAKELGADAFVAKPFNVDELLRVLKELEPGTLSAQA